MTRNLKTPGLALVAILAVGVITASTASAQTQGKLTSDGPVTLKGEETGVLLANAKTAFGASTSCPGSTYTGHSFVTQHETATDPTKKHGLVANGSTTITITPHYATHCTLLQTYPVTVTMNGCDFVLHIGQTTGEQTATKKTYGVTTDIECPTGKVIETEIWEHGQAHTSPPWCTLKFKEQTGLTGPHLSSTPVSHDIDLEGTLTGLHIERKGTKPALCPTQTINNGSLHIDVTYRGFNGGGSSTGITITD